MGSFQTKEVSTELYHSGEKNGVGGDSRSHCQWLTNNVESVSILISPLSSEQDRKMHLWKRLNNVLYSL